MYLQKHDVVVTEVHRKSIIGENFIIMKLFIAIIVTFTPTGCASAHSVPFVQCCSKVYKAETNTNSQGDGRHS